MTEENREERGGKTVKGRGVLENNVKRVLFFFFYLSVTSMFTLIFCITVANLLLHLHRPERGSRVSALTALV